jgi:O-antigen/teichoic acid export membrane protein
MGNTKRVLKNTSVLMMSHVISKVLYFLIIVLITRLLGVEEYGKFTFSLSFVLLFSIIADFGINTLTVREVAKNKDLANKYLIHGSLIKFFFSLVTFAFVTVVVNSVHSSQDVIFIVYVLGLKIIIDSFTMFIVSFFQAFEQMKYEAYLNVIEKTGLMILSLLAFKLNYGIIGIAYIFLAIALIKLVSSLIILNNSLISWNSLLKAKFDYSFCGNILKNSWQFALIAIIGMVYFSMDTVMLEIIKGSYAVGLYNAAHKLMDGFTFIPQMFTTALFPVFAYLSLNSKERLIAGYEKGFKVLFIVAFPLALGGTILSKSIISLLFGAEFIKSAATMQVLFWALFFIFFNYITGVILNSINKQNLLTLDISICLVVNLVLNLLLIPKYSFMGAAIATMSTQGLLFMLNYLWIVKNLHALAILRIIIKPVVSGLLMGLLVQYFVRYNLFLVIFVGASFYVTLLFALKVITRHDIAMIFSRRFQES